MPNPPSDKRFRHPAEPEGNLISLGAILPFLRRSAGLIIVTVLIGAVLGAAYIYMTPRGFVAAAELLIERQTQPFFSSRDSIIDFAVDNAQVESQIEILRSERIAAAVINELNLADDPEFGGADQPTDFRKTREAIDSFLARVGARRIGQSYMIAVSFRSADADKAARITNAVTRAYLEDHIQAKIAAIRIANAWAEQRIAQVGAQLNGAAREVQKFRSTYGIVDVANQQNSYQQYMYVDQLTELEARVQSYRKLYESFLEGLTRNAQQESFPSSAARIISPATTPLAPSYPKTQLVLAFAILIGGLTGIGLALVRQMLDRTVRDPKQVRQMLGVDCLGMLPHHSRFGRGLDPYDGTTAAPFSPFADRMRAIKVALDLAARSQTVVVIGVTSANSGEGKSTVAAGLATQYAIAGRRTLLIDGNFRQPSISRRLASSAATGLVELLKQPTGSEGVVPLPIVRSKSGLEVLPAGVGHQVANSSDALGSARMGALLERLRASFEVIVIDFPALTGVVDARAAGRFLDACILVAAWGKTQLDALEDARDLIEPCGIPLLGVVINQSRDAVASTSLRRQRLKGYGLTGRWSADAAALHPFEIRHDTPPLSKPAAASD